MRGTGTRRFVRFPLTRFIPAHAGNRPLAQNGAHPSAVHPRACGEQRARCQPFAGFLGSSPRMRGTAARLEEKAGADRFIPAHAGNRQRPSVRQAERSVHPRACGEQRDRAVPRHRPSGSSPRMRGTGRGAGPTVHHVRFIPAHAGNSPSTLGSTLTSPVHPRACGEQSGKPK